MILNGYCSELEAKAWLNLADASLDDLIVDALVETASRAVDGYCGQSFYTVSDTRTFYGCGYMCKVDPVADTAGATVAVGTGTGTFPTPWAAGVNFRWEPANGVVDGIAGHPATALRTLGGQVFPTSAYGLENVQVTASFGWEAVPAPVKQATLHLIAELWKRKDAGPYGTIGSQEFGTIYLSPDAMRTVTSLLTPYGTGSSVGIGALV